MTNPLPPLPSLATISEPDRIIVYRSNRSGRLRLASLLEGESE